MKRLSDIILSIFGLGALLLPILIIIFFVKLSSKGPTLHWSDRIGKNNVLFKMPKFRTMKQGTPDVATHLLKDPSQFITSIGVFLRRNSLDEIPQLYSVLTGDMSLVGPRPALYNQYDLISVRDKKGINQLKPGITGWAQINGRDELSIYKKVQYDEEYLRRASVSFDIHIIWLTIIRTIKKDGISH